MKFRNKLIIQVDRFIFIKFVEFSQVNTYSLHPQTKQVFVLFVVGFVLFYFYYYYYLLLTKAWLHLFFPLLLIHTKDILILLHGLIPCSHFQKFVYPRNCFPIRIYLLSSSCMVNYGISIDFSLISLLTDFPQSIGSCLHVSLHY